MTTYEKRSYWLQTILLFLTMVGIALAAEHRITIVEATNTELKAQTAMLGEALKAMYENQVRITVDQTKLAVLIDQIEKRHAVEDGRKSK